MRNNPTEPERRLWLALQNSKLGELKFRRQAVKDRRIIDFYCPSIGLAVEVDGETHDREADVERDEAFERALGIRTIRFTNEEVMLALDGVLAAILAAEGDSTTPRPLLQKGGGEAGYSPPIAPRKNRTISR